MSGASKSIGKMMHHRVLVVQLLIAAVLTIICIPATLVHAAPIQLFGLNYNTRQGPDWDWEKCKSYERIYQDLQMLQKLTNKIRILSLTDCGQGNMVLTAANALNMQVFIGLWVGPDHAEKFVEELNELQVLLDRYSDDYPDLILGVTVGSEAIYRGDATVDEMIVYMNQAYELMQQHPGMQGKPVSIVDIAPKYEAEVNLRKAVNVTFTNTFPFWEATPIDQAKAELESDIGNLLSLQESRDKPFIMGETGWPDGGFIEGVGVASTENQAQYFADSYCLVIVEKGWDTFWFSGIDDDWRQEQDPNNTVEGTFGLMHSDLTLKDHFQNLEFTCSDGVTYSFAEMDWSIPTLATAAPSPLDPSSCAAHAQCKSLELPGLCCPTADGVTLGCCGATTPTTPPATSPVAPPVATPVAEPTVPPATVSDPTEAPTDATNTETESPTDIIVASAPVASPTTNGSSPDFTLVPVAVPDFDGGTGGSGTGSPTPDESLPVAFFTPSPSAATGRLCGCMTMITSIVVATMMLMVSMV